MKRTAEVDGAKTPAKSAPKRGTGAGGGAGRSEPNGRELPKLGAKFLHKALRSTIQRYSLDAVPARVNGHAQGANAGNPAFAKAWAEAVKTAADKGTVAAAWLGHCSVMLGINGRTLLTDPVFSARIGLRVGPMTFGLTRQSPAPLTSACFQPADVLLLSHAHFDHLDKPTLRRLAHRHTTVVAAKNLRRLVPRGFGEVLEIDWGERLEVRGLTISALRPKHWGARTAWDRHRGYNSYLIETGGGPRVLFAGDTALTDAYAGLADGGELALSIFGIGGYEPWVHAHANPEQVWSMAGPLGGRLLPVHHSTFRLSDEHPAEPIERLVRAAGKEAGRIIRAAPGDVLETAGAKGY